MTYVSDINKSHNREQIAKLYPKAFKRDSSISDRVNQLKTATSERKSSYKKTKGRAKEIHTFERMPQKEVFSNLNETL